MAILCPKCGGNQVQSVKMVYQNGVSTSVISGQSRGIAFSGDGNLYGTVNNFNGTNLSKTALAQQFAPPDTGHIERLSKKIGEHTMHLWASVAAVIFSIFMLKSDTSQAFFIGFFAFIGGVGGTIIYSIMLTSAKGQMNTASDNDQIERERLSEWNNSFTCFTCGNVFQATDDRKVIKQKPLSITNIKEKPLSSTTLNDASAGKIPKFYWNYRESDLIEFFGTGDLFKFEYGNWVFDGPLPRDFKLAKYGPPAKLKIRGNNGVEYISEFSRGLKDAEDDKLIPTEEKESDNVQPDIHLMPDLVDRIAKLNEMRLSGALSLEEFEYLKKRLLQTSS